MELLEKELVADQLHYHRVFARTGGNPQVEKVEPRAKRNEIEAFIAQVLRSVCHRANVIYQGESMENHRRNMIYQGELYTLEDVRAFWAAPMSDADVKYFDINIVKAVEHQCALNHTLETAKEFATSNLNTIFTCQGNSFEVMIARSIMSSILCNTYPVNVTFIYVLSFASYACCRWVLNEKHFHLAPGIVKATADIFQIHFPYEWIYHDFKTWASAYSFRHQQRGCMY